MSRSVWKVPYISNIFFSNFFFKKSTFFIWRRNSIISNFFISKRFKIYNGRWQHLISITSNMVGHKLGEFSMTKRMGRDIHFEKKKKTK